MRSLGVSLLSLLACILGFAGCVLALGACGNSSPPAMMMMPGPPPPAELHFLTRADPNDAWVETTRSFWGDQVAVHFAHLPAGTVTVAASSSSYQSSADFAVGSDGALDLAGDAPQSGSWSGADADGLFWSMRSADPNALEDFDVTVSASAGGQPLISATLHRTWGPDGVTPLKVSDNGLLGVFVAPAGGGAHPALITFGGSEGGLETTSGNTIFVDAPVFLADLSAASAAAKDAATIAVEKTAGPILMLAGADDQLWASCALSQIAVERLKSSGHTAKWNDDFQCYDMTGHNVTTPDLPTTSASLAWFPDVAAYFALGGTPAGIAHAARESDTRIRGFLKRL